MTFLRGAWLQIWQYGHGYAAEQSLDDAIALCRQYGLAGLAVKAFDGQTWMGAIDPAEDALRNVNQVREQRQRCEAAGLGYAVWVNPLHGSRDFLSREGELYVAAGLAAGMVWWDSEPYQHFWGAWRPEGDAWYLMEAFRASAPNVVNVWQPDPRPARLAELRPEEWAPWMNVYAPQAYAADFHDGRTVSEWLDICVEQARQFGIAECAPTITASETAESIDAAARHATELGLSGLLFWRMGSANAQQLAAISSIKPAPPAPDPCQAIKDGLRAELSRKRISRKRLAALI